MIRVFNAELSKLTRPRVLIATAVVVLIASAIATTVVFLSAPDTGDAPRRGATLAMLSETGGGTEAFSTGMSFTGFFVFVVFTANWAVEFSQGTFRTLLMKQPRRLSLLAGKLAGLLAFAAVVLLAAEVVTLVMSLAIAPARDVATGAWFSFDGLRAASGNYANALFGVTAWASLGMALAVLVRSTPLALGIGIAWAGPFEHITQRAWEAVSGWYPGLLLESLAVGGTSDVSYTRTLVMLAGYTALAVTTAGLTFARRDITA